MIPVVGGSIKQAVSSSNRSGSSAVDPWTDEPSVSTTVDDFAADHALGSVSSTLMALLKEAAGKGCRGSATALTMAAIALTGTSAGEGPDLSWESLINDGLLSLPDQLTFKP